MRWGVVCPARCGVRRDAFQQVAKLCHRAGGGGREIDGVPAHDGEAVMNGAPGHSDWRGSVGNVELGNFFAHAVAAGLPDVVGVEGVGGAAGVGRHGDAAAADIGERKVLDEVLG